MLEESKQELEESKGPTKVKITEMEGTYVADQ